MKYVRSWRSHIWIALTAILTINTSAVADEYADARAAVVASYQSQDYPAMVAAALRAAETRPGYAGAMFNLALAHVLNGNAPASLAVLENLLAKGVDYGADEADEFVALRDLPGWGAYRKGLDTLRSPVGEADVAMQLDDTQFVPEGIAMDERGDIYLGSIRKGQLNRGTDVLSDRAGHWSVFGMRFDDEGGLWFASAAVAQLLGVGNDEGRTGLFRIDVDSGEISRSALLPQREDKQLLGDLVIDGNSIYTTDSLTGVLYRYDVKEDRFDILVEKGVFGSPQGLVLDESGRWLYVADYIGGLFRVSLDDGTSTRLEVDESITDYGIDGLYRHGDELIAIQNGIRPHRVVAFRLDSSGLAIGEVRTLVANHNLFDEPTLGVVRGDDFYFVANSHWNRFDRNNQLPDGLSGPIILKVGLRSH